MMVINMLMAPMEKWTSAKTGHTNKVTRTLKIKNTAKNKNKFKTITTGMKNASDKLVRD